MNVHRMRSSRDRWRSWVRVDAATGASEEVEVAKPELSRRLGLPARDLRLLDPSFLYPSTILVRDRAVVCNLKPARCIITADEAFVLQDQSPEVARYVAEVQRRLVDRANDDQPFEFMALDVALQATLFSLDSQTTELETKAYPLLDELTRRLRTLNLQRAWRIKSSLVVLTREVQKVRDEIEQLMDDDGDMAECYLTEKKKRMEASSLDEQRLEGVGNDPSPSAFGRLEKGISIGRSRLDGSKRPPDSNHQSTQELEMLLEDYFRYIDATLNKLTSMKEYIDNTESFINIQLDSVRNKLMKFEVLLGSAAFVVAIFAVVPGVFGMNFEGVTLYKVPHAFEGTLAITGVCSLLMFGCFLWYLRRRMFF